MKETGMMFKAPLVRAILDGKKTQTRRIVKPQPAPDKRFQGWILDSTDSKRIGKASWGYGTGGLVSGIECVGSPCGKPGDRIYVRETFYAWGRWETRYSEEKGRDEWHFVDLTVESGRAYEFYDPLLGKLRRRGQTGPGPTWWKRPAILMPKAAARIWLEVTGVRVERLHDISDADCWAEGAIAEVRPDQFSETGVLGTDGNAYLSPRSAFRALWESTGARWDDNPWVWVIDFKRIERAASAAQGEA